MSRHHSHRHPQQITRLFNKYVEEDNGEEIRKLILEGRKLPKLTETQQEKHPVIKDLLDRYQCLLEMEAEEKKKFLQLYRDIKNTTIGSAVLKAYQTYDTPQQLERHLEVYFKINAISADAQKEKIKAILAIHAPLYVYVTDARIPWLVGDKLHALIPHLMQVWQENYSARDNIERLVQNIQTFLTQKYLATVDLLHPSELSSFIERTRQLVAFDKERTGGCNTAHANWANGYLAVSIVLCLATAIGSAITATGFTAESDRYHFKTWIAVAVLSGINLTVSVAAWGCLGNTAMNKCETAFYQFLNALKHPEPRGSFLGCWQRAQLTAPPLPRDKTAAPAEPELPVKLEHSPQESRKRKRKGFLNRRPGQVTWE